MLFKLNFIIDFEFIKTGQVLLKLMITYYRLTIY